MALTKYKEKRNFKASPERWWKTIPTITEALKALYQVVTVPEQVIVWDEGFYELADAEGMDKKVQDAALQKGIPAGKLHIILHGKKLKGEYGLVKTHGMGENAWLLFKVKDDYVSKEDITLKDKSVISEKTLAEIEKTTTNFYGAKRVKESSGKSEKKLRSTNAMM